MNKVTINNKTYDVPELTFAHSKILEQYGVTLLNMMDPNKMLTIVSAFVALVTGSHPDIADHLIEQHILGGGTLDEIYGAYTRALGESHFFKKLLENQEKKLKAELKQNQTKK